MVRGVVVFVCGDGEFGLIWVSVEKIDSLINLVGELVIIQVMFGQFGEQFDLSCYECLQYVLVQFEYNICDLQELVMLICMLLINFIFSCFFRLVCDIVMCLGKQVELYLYGEYIELDKSVIEKFSDLFIYIVCNSIDYGIEMFVECFVVGKLVSGMVKFVVSYQGGSVVVEVFDDGCGLLCLCIFVKVCECNLLVYDGMSDVEVW